MKRITHSPRGTLLNIALVEEHYGSSLLASVGIHALALLAALYGALLLPRTEPVQIGTGPGGGTGGGGYTVGVADDLGGGVGMTKPSLVPQPPALPAEMEVKQEAKPDAVSFPDTVVPPKPRKKEPTRQSKKAPPAPPVASNVVPTQAQPGAGGTGGMAGGSGGGRGGGSGVSIGSGSGGWGDSWYARTVESRIGSNWIKPVDLGARIEIIYSFLVGPDGSIYDIRKLKSCGNDALDLTAERAIRTSNPLAPPPPELRGRPLEFAAQFVYPPSP
jgi:TonB family protein